MNRNHVRWIIAALIIALIFTCGFLYAQVTTTTSSTSPSPLAAATVTYSNGSTKIVVTGHVIKSTTDSAGNQTIVMGP